MKPVISIDGRLVDPAAATIPALDHGFLFGDSVYETMRTYRRRLFLADRHLDRLARSAEATGFPPPDRQRILQSLKRCIDEAGNDGECRIRLVVTRGAGDLHSSPRSCHSPSTLIYCWPLPDAPMSLYVDGGHVIRSRYTRSVEMAEVKTGSLIRQVLAVHEAESRDAYEALLLTTDGFVSDGATCNVYAVRDGEVHTPSTEAGILSGITRSVVIDLAHRLRIPVHERLFRIDEFISADEAFLTSTTREVVPITRFDGELVGNGKPGPVTRRLLDAYRAEVHTLMEPQ